MARRKRKLGPARRIWRAVGWRRAVAGGFLFVCVAAGFFLAGLYTPI